MSWHPVAKLGDMHPGDVIAVEVGGLEIVVGLDGTTYFAVQRRCLHRGGDLAEGIIARGHLVCAHHGWRFSTATGRHDLASDVCLIRYPVRVHGEHIEIDPTPEREEST